MIGKWSREYVIQKTHVYKIQTPVFGVHQFLKYFAGIDFSQFKIVRDQNRILFPDFVKRKRNSLDIHPAKMSSFKVTIGLGLAEMDTGNNLRYYLVIPMKK